MSKSRKAKSVALLLALAFVFTSLFSGIGAVAFAADEGTRLYGDDRYETAVEISQEGWETSDDVVLVRGDDFPDALAAGPLAQKLDAPILLTKSTALPDVTKDEIDRLGAETVYIVGGTGVVTEAVASATGKTVERIAGDDRYETAVAVAEKLAELGVSTDEVVIARSDDYADALAAAAVKPAMPILFAGKAKDASLADATEDALVDLGVKDVVIVGGTGVVSAEIEEQIDDVVADVTRVAGDTRIETAVAIAEEFEPADGYKGAVLATGYDYPDALAGGPYAAKNGYALLLTGKAANPIDSAVIDFIEANTGIKADTIVALGGPTIVLDAAIAAAVEAATPAALAIVSVSAINVNQVEVVFNQAVDTEAATVQVKKGAAVYSSGVEWNEAGDTAIVTTVIDLPAGDYTAVVSGLTEEALTADFTVDAEVASSIEVTSLTVDDETAAAQVAFVVKNQYGADMEINSNDSDLTISAYNVTQGTDVKANIGTPAAQYFTLDTSATDAYKVGDEIRFTLVYKDLITQAIVLVADPSSSAAIEFGDIVLAEDDVRLNVSDGTVKLNYTLLDQYGNPTDFNAAGAVALPTTTIDGVQFISSDTSVISAIAIVNNADGYGEIVLTIAGDGTATITAVINESGDIATKKITVEKNPVVASVEIAAPTMLVASQDDPFDLALVITDQYGDIIKSVTGLSFSIDLTGAVLTPDDTDGVTTLNVDLTGVADETVNSTTEVTIEATFSSEVIGSVSFDVEPEAEAQQIKSISIPTVFEVGADLDVTSDDIVVVDQYGRDFTDTLTVSEVTDTDNAFTVVTPNIEADSEGTATFKVAVGTAELEFDVTAIASAGIESYTINEIDTLYAAGVSGDYAVAVTLAGVDADGNAVVLASNAPDIITTSNASVAAFDGTTVYGVAEGTATISAWLDGVKVATTTVTVSEEAPVAVSVEWTATTIVADTTADATTIVKVLDQYGVDITASTVLFFSGGTEIATNGAVTDADDGTDVVETITVITSNGLSATEDITIE